jgi:hypothetical protein
MLDFIFPLYFKSLCIHLWLCILMVFEDRWSIQKRINKPLRDYLIDLLFWLICFIASTSNVDIWWFLSFSFKSWLGPHYSPLISCLPLLRPKPFLCLPILSLPIWWKRLNWNSMFLLKSANFVSTGSSTKGVLLNSLGMVNLGF